MIDKPSRRRQKSSHFLGAVIKIVILFKWQGITLPGLTTDKCAGIVPRLEHGAFLVLTCGGALLVETGRGINVIVA